MVRRDHQSDPKHERDAGEYEGMKTFFKALLSVVKEPAFLIGVALIIFASLQRAGCECSVQIDSRNRDADADLRD